MGREDITPGLGEADDVHGRTEAEGEIERQTYGAAYLRPQGFGNNVVRTSGADFYVRADGGEREAVADRDEVGQDHDELFGLAGGVASDLEDIIQRHPREMATFLRAAKNLSQEEMQQLAEEVRRLREKDNN